MKRLLVLAVASCAADAPPAPPPPVAPVAVEVPKLVPRPGIDLIGPIATPERSATVHHALPPVDLVSDRAVVHLDVPELPRGGSTGFQLPDERPAWVARIPDAVQLPAVAYGDGRVYVSGGFESTTFYAMNATTGHIDWATQNLEDNGPTAAIFDDGRVVFNTESCTLFALDSKTGKRLWLKNLGDPTLAQAAVADGLVFASHPASGGQELSAYRVRDGELVWTQPIDGELLAAPMIGGDAVYASTTTGTTYKIKRATGRFAWSRRLDATTVPWFANGELYVTRQTKNHEQQVVVDAATGNVIREERTSTGHYAWDVPTDIRDWKTVWAFEGSRPVVERGVRYVAMGGEIHASDAASGEPLWQRSYAGKEAKRSVGSVALAGSEIVIATREGKLFGLDIDTGYTLWSYDIGHRVVAEPVVAKGWVYAATLDGYVVALNVADATLDGWHMFGGNPQHDGPVTAKASARSASHARDR